MPKPVVILGMHRSGTSFLVKALRLCGLWIGGDEELSTVEGRAFEGNAKGNYENRRIKQLNDKILAEAGGSWFDPPTHFASPGRYSVEINETVSLLNKSKPAENSVIGWKDPRMSITLPAWGECFPEGFTPVVVYRHPRLVAGSLQSRNKMEVRRGIELWKSYYRSIFSYFSVDECVGFRFDCEEPQIGRQIHDICNRLKLEFKPELLRQWYDPALVRESVKEQVPLVDDPECAELWGRLCGLWPGVQDVRKEVVSR